MKKFIFVTMALALLLGATSCKKQQTVEKTITSDYTYMSEHHPDFVWYESQITLADYLDNSSSTAFKYVDNVFQYFEDGQPHVIIFTHTGGKVDSTKHNDIWIEDCAMTPADIKLTYTQAYEQVMKSNYPKPHSKNCILREPVGPYSCNPQYVFGTIDEPLFVDAVTGKVVNTDPAFNKRE